jgi:2,3-dihydroxyphenylpropionate 1,2-dioxygenase
MTRPEPGPSRAFLTCAPHVPFLAMQDRSLNEGFWRAYEARIAAFKLFDPELVIAFGADHYDGQFLKSMPTFQVGQVAEAIDDQGGHPGRLNVPKDIAIACAEHLVDRHFDISTSYAMQVDHGFSGILHAFMGRLDARPVVPIFINALCHPRPTFKRCREFGAAVGQFAATLSKRVAFLGSGGLSHDTGPMFPQFDTADNETVREYIVHGGTRGGLSREQWIGELNKGLEFVNGQLLQRVPGVGAVDREWDAAFLKTLTAGDLAAFDSWVDADVARRAGNGAGEVRQWIAAASAAQAVEARPFVVDYYEPDSPIGVAAVVMHA